MGLFWGVFFYKRFGNKKKNKKENVKACQKILNTNATDRSSSGSSR
jgi:hypothetical protein